MFFHHQTLKKYTACILNLFNEIEVQYLDSKKNLKSTIVPIQFTSREKSNVLKQYTAQQLYTGNTNILPRLGLYFESLEPAYNRATSKFVKINKSLPDGEKLNYQYNRIPYNFNYRLVAQCRGMNEASMILEQIVSYFNPSYAFKVQEIAYNEPETILLVLNSTDIEQTEYEDYSKDIVTITFNLTLKGNIYPSIKEQKVIKQVDMFFNQLHNDTDYHRQSLIESKVFDKQVKKQIKYNFDKQAIPEIKDIIRVKDKLEVLFNDKDNKLEWNEFAFLWTYDGANKGTNGTKVVDFANKNYGTTKVSVQVIDYHGNKSEVFSKDF